MNPPGDDTPRRPATPGISVVIAAYNPIPVLGEQLDALAGQDYTGDVEVVVSDNRGDAAVRAYVAAHPLSAQMPVRWIDSSATPGTPHARNAGTRAATHPLIAYCDQDDRVHAGWLSAIADAAARHDLVGGPLERDTLNDPVVARWRALPEPDALPVLARFLPITFGCNLAIWRDTFDAIGGWDENYLNAGSDVEFCWRAQLHGYTLGFAPDAMVAYRFRTGLRETWAQACDYAIEEARVAKQFGAPGRARYWFFLHLGVSAATAPLWPWGWSRARRGAWCWITGNLVGRVRGSIRHRVVYP